ncbi:hypothetical protein MTO96_029849 [Rhipicephalus appendiculatus]
MEARWHAKSLGNLEPSDDPWSEPGDWDRSSPSSSEEEVERLHYTYENSDDKRCVQAAVIVTFVMCLSIVLVLIFLDSVDTKLPQTSTYRHVNASIKASIKAIVRPRYRPGERPEKFIICTLGGNAVSSRLYPPDGLCNWIFYTHVGYDAQNRSLAPTGPGNWPSWGFFLRQKSGYMATRLAPSLYWKNLTGLQKHRAVELNRTLSALRMAGLAMLNVRVGVHQVAALAQLFATLASANPGMFLALGVSFERLNDRTASWLVPTALLDGLVTPLSLFILETHLPAPGGNCRTSFSTALEPVYGEHGSQRLTFCGARSFMAQPALRYANPAALARCLSIAAGALVFHLPPGERPQLGARCTHWSLERLETVCGLDSVRVNVEAHAMYGQTQRTFFSYESAREMWFKVFPTLQSMVFDELPTCLAVYALDLDATPGHCYMEQERPNRLIYTVYDVIKDVETTP